MAVLGMYGNDFRGLVEDYNVKGQDKEAGILSRSDA